MTPRELDQGKRLLQRIQNIPLSGPELDEGFCVFALRVCSAESVGRRKLIPGKYYFFLTEVQALIQSVDAIVKSTAKQIADNGLSKVN